MSNIGHNSRISGDQLRSIVERFENLTEEEEKIKTDKKELLAEAKGNGYDLKTLKTLIKLKNQAENEREEAFYLLDTYMAAVGMSRPWIADEDYEDGKE